MSNIHANTILKETSKAFGVKYTALLDTKNSKHDVCEARAVSVYLLHKKGYTLNALRRSFFNSAKHYHDRVMAHIDVEPGYKDKIERIARNVILKTND